MIFIWWTNLQTKMVLPPYNTPYTYNRWFCVWVTQMLLYGEIQLKVIWKLWKQLHADLSVAPQSSQHGLNSHSRAALPICKLSYGMIFCPRLRTSQPYYKKGRCYSHGTRANKFTLWRYLHGGITRANKFTLCHYLHGGISRANKFTLWHYLHGARARGHHPGE